MLLARKPNGRGATLKSWAGGGGRQPPGPAVGGRHPVRRGRGRLRGRQTADRGSRFVLANGAEPAVTPSGDFTEDSAHASPRSVSLPTAARPRDRPGRSSLAC